MPRECRGLSIVGGRGGGGAGQGGWCAVMALGGVSKAFHRIGPEGFE
jgi:hypothetical protein